MNKTNNLNLYEIDFLEWIQKTATLLKEKRFEQLDLENLIEEIEAMGRSEKNQAINRVITIVERLLKIIYWEQQRDYNLRGSAVLGVSPKSNCRRGWKQTIVTQRSKLFSLLENSPSLRRYLEENWLKCYERAGKNFFVVSELKVDKNPIFSLYEVLTDEFFG